MKQNSQIRRSNRLTQSSDKGVSLFLNKVGLLQNDRRIIDDYLQSLVQRCQYSIFYLGNNVLKDQKILRETSNRLVNKPINTFQNIIALNSLKKKEHRLQVNIPYIQANLQTQFKFVQNIAFSNQNKIQARIKNIGEKKRVHSSQDEISIHQMPNKKMNHDKFKLEIGNGAQKTLDKNSSVFFKTSIPQQENIKTEQSIFIKYDYDQIKYKTKKNFLRNFTKSLGSLNQLINKDDDLKAVQQVQAVQEPQVIQSVLALQAINGKVSQRLQKFVKNNTTTSSTYKKNYLVFYDYKKQQQITAKCLISQTEEDSNVNLQKVQQLGQQGVQTQRLSIKRASKYQNLAKLSASKQQIFDISQIKQSIILGNSSSQKNLIKPQASSQTKLNLDCSIQKSRINSSHNNYHQISISQQKYAIDKIGNQCVSFLEKNQLNRNIQMQIKDNLKQYDHFKRNLMKANQEVTVEELNEAITNFPKIPV